MRHWNRRWAIWIAAGLNGLTLIAQQPAAVPTATQAIVDAETFRGKRTDLQKHPFRIDGLVMTINGYHKWNVGEIFDIRVDNPSNHHMKFDVGNMFVVNSDGFEFNGPPGYNSAIAPGAWIAYSYQLVGGFSGAQVDFKPPFKIFFGDRLLAEVSD